MGFLQLHHLKAGVGFPLLFLFMQSLKKSRQKKLQLLSFRKAHHLKAGVGFPFLFTFRKQSKRGKSLRIFLF